MKPLALQLYSVRDYAKEDFAGTLKKVAAMGYKGVEPAGFHDMKPAELRQVVEDLGMKVCATHGPKPTLDNISEVVDTIGDLGLDRVVSGYGTADFDSLDQIKKTAEMVSAIADKLAESNVKYCLHNHYWEFTEIEGRLAYDWFAEIASPLIEFEIDAYWTSNFQANVPAEQVAKFAKRMPLLHIKDGPIERNTPMLPLGTGILDIPSIVAAADEDVLDWIIVELDRCDMDMLEAVEQSYKYMTSKGLASGTV